MRVLAVPEAILAAAIAALAEAVHPRRSFGEVNDLIRQLQGVPEVAPRGKARG